MQSLVPVRKLLLAALFLVTTSVSGCGQKGPLILPQPNEPPPQSDPQRPSGHQQRT